MSDREDARSLEREIVGGDAGRARALERLKAMWFRSGGIAPPKKKKRRRSSTVRPTPPSLGTARALSSLATAVMVDAAMRLFTAKAPLSAVDAVERSLMATAAKAVPFRKDPGR